MTEKEIQEEYGPLAKSALSWIGRAYFRFLEFDGVMRRLYVLEQENAKLLKARAEWQKENQNQSSPNPPNEPTKS